MQVSVMTRPKWWEWECCGLTRGVQPAWSLALTAAPVSSNLSTATTSPYDTENTQLVTLKARVFSPEFVLERF